MPENADPVKQFALRHALGLLIEANVIFPNDKIVDEPFQEFNRYPMLEGLNRVGQVALMLRTTIGRSARSVAIEAGISPMQYRRIEKLEGEPTESKIKRIANTFDVPASYLFGEADVMRNPDLLSVRVGDVVKELRKKNKVPQKTFLRSGISVMQVYRIEAGPAEPTESKIRALAIALNVPIRTLFGETKLPESVS